MADYIVARIKGTITLTGGRAFLCPAKTTLTSDLCLLVSQQGNENE